MLLRGTLTPGSDPPVDNDTFDLRRGQEEDGEQSSCPSTYPPVIPDEGHEM